MYERKLETKQNCNILTPTLLAITVFLSHSPGLLNRGPGGPASLSAVFLYRILSPTHLISNCSVRGLWAPSAGCWLSLPHLVSNWSGLQTLNRGSQGPFCRVLAFSTTSYPQLVWSPNCTELYNSSTPTHSLVDVTIALIQPAHSQGYILIFLERMHLLFT